MRYKRYILCLLVLMIFISGCGPTITFSSVSSTSGNKVTATATQKQSNSSISCPIILSANPENCVSPGILQSAYHIDTLHKQGYTGKGQTVVIIVSYGSPTLQEDLDEFSSHYGLPQKKIKILSPLGTVPFNESDYDMSGWAMETSLDVQSVHAVAPDADIVVLTSPVAETEGTVGLTEFLQLEQYAVNNNLGQIISQSWGASEATFTTTQDKQFLQTFANFYRESTLNKGITFVAGSGDFGATDVINEQLTMSTEQTVGFPADCPWVLVVGGTTLKSKNGNISEMGWSGSGGGISKIFDAPDYQQTYLPSGIRSQANGKHTDPDISANGDSSTGFGIVYSGRWSMVGGTSASAPAWAGMIALANQIASKPLGFVNPKIYQLAASSQYKSMFRDVTVGNNSYHGVKGFDATSGYDLVTGWGVPLADQLLPALGK
jgi:subtilase family serine protease